MPAMPGRVSGGAEQRQRRQQQAQIEEQRDVGIDTEQPVEQHHEDHDQRHRDEAGGGAGMDRIGTEIGTDGALLDDGERRRQRTGAQHQRQILGALRREGAGDLTRAAGDRLADIGCRQHLVVEHDGEGLADILRRHVGEAARAGRIELEDDDRLVVVEGEIRGIELAAIDHHPLAHQVEGLLPGPRLAGLVGHRQQVVARRHVALHRFAEVARRVHQAEGQLRRLADHRFRMLRIVDAGKLHQDPVGAFARDGGLAGAELVDAAADDADRLLDRLALPRRERLRRVADRHQPVRLRRGDEVGIDRLERRLGLVEIAGIAQRQHDMVVLDREVGIAGPVLDELRAQRVEVAGQTLLGDGRHVDLKQQVAAALQVEAEADLALGQP